MGIFFRVARRILMRRPMYRFSRKLHLLGLHGMGILNYESDALSGEAHFIDRFLPAFVGDEHALVIDVGAHDGTYSSRVAAALKDVCVYAFEPHPVSFGRLQAAAPKNVHCVHAALGGEEGTARLFDHAGASGSQHASLYEGAIRDLHGGDAVAWEVPVHTLDHVLAEHGLDRITLLKIDTEGHELSVLQGASTALTRGNIDIIHFEFNSMNAVSGCHFKDFTDLLSDYQLHRMLPYGLVPLSKYDPMRGEIFAYQNIVAVRRGLCEQGPLGIK